MGKEYLKLDEIVEICKIKALRGHYFMDIPFDKFNGRYEKRLRDMKFKLSLVDKTKKNLKYYCCHVDTQLFVRIRWK